MLVMRMPGVTLGSAILDQPNPSISSIPFSDWQENALTLQPSTKPQPRNAVAIVSVVKSQNKRQI